MRKAKITQKIAFFLTGCVACLSASAQIDTAFHAYLEGAGPITSTVKNVVFNSYTLLNSFGAPNYITGVKKDGSPLFRNQVVKHETTVVSDMITTFDDKVVYVGYAHPCDYTDTNQVNFITSLDSSGSYIYDLNYKDSSVYTGMFLDGFKQIRQYADSSFYVINDSCIFHFNRQGILLTRKRFPIPGGGMSLCISPKNTLVIARGNYLSKTVYEMDTACNLLKQSPSFVEYKKLVNIGNRYYGLSSTGSIFKMDTSFNVLDSAKTLQGPRTITDFSVAGDTLICSAIANTNQFSVFRIDTAFTDTSTFNPGFPGILPQKVVQEGPSMFFLSNEKYQTYHNPNIALTEVFKSNNQTSIKNDVGVTMIKADSGYAVFNYMWMWNLTRWLYYYRVQITVTNFGQNMIPGFRVNHKPDGMPICGTLFYTEYFYVPLAPGQSTTVTSQMIMSDGGAQPGPPPTTGSTYTFAIPGACFWTSVPARKVDKDHINDEICTSITFSNVVGVDEFSDKENDVKVYPNPFTDEVMVETESFGDVGVELCTITGAHLKKEKFETGNKLKISCAEIAQGIYFLKVRWSNGRTKTFKLVK